MKIRSKSTNKNYLILSVIFTLSIATVFGVGIYTAVTANALSYSTSEDISFTFAPTLSIGLSTNSLTIDNLVPGTTSDSNSVSVTVSSNTPYGYVLSAGVGSAESSDPYYNTSDLIHNNSTISNVFSSVDTSASLEALTADNTWGYSTSTDGGTSWSTYSGLSNTTTKPLLDISDPATPSTIDFKIAARSASTQASGTYNNVITFYAVGKPEPLTIDKMQYMQDFNGLTETDLESVLSSMPTERQYKLIDNRDDKEYWLAKEADGNIWMTQNLDLCIGCEGTAELTSRNTDLNESGSGAYSNGYTLAGGLITWTPTSTAITSNTIINGTAVAPAFSLETNSSKMLPPYSAEGGEKFIYTSNSNKNDVLYTTLDECVAASHSVDDCTHYHIGNYYNWPAVVASNDSRGLMAVYNRDIMAANSICPAGWKLPKGNNTTFQTEDNFGKLLSMSGVANGTNYTYETGFNNIRVSPLFFLRGGYIEGGSLINHSVSGSYWDNNAFTTGQNYDRTSARYFHFNNGQLTSSIGGYRYNGRSVRCLVHQ